jgi:hypothetical protein
MPFAHPSERVGFRVEWGNVRVNSGSDWRDDIGFDSPVLLADVLPGEDARCATCGADSEPRPRTELWAVKHKHPKHHNGFVRFYCREHTPVIVRREPAAPPKASRERAARAPRATAPRRPAAVETPKAICPNCFVEVPPSGVCGMCGTAV